MPVHRAYRVRAHAPLSSHATTLNAWADLAKARQRLGEQLMTAMVIEELGAHA